jgi:glycosyltransferase involved in cell wall biosynthesis
MGAPAKSALARLWQHGRPDVVHVVTEGPLGWSAVSAARRLGLPVTTDFHTNFHTYSRHYGLGLLRLPIHLYLRWLHNRAQRTLVPTDALRSELHGLGYRNLATVARGVDGALFTPSRRSPELRRSWGAGEGDLVAVCVGRLAPEKNLPLAVEAFHRMRAIRPGTKLVMVGDGPARAALQRLHPDVAFAGSRTGEDLARHYASADLFLFPSTTETYGNVTLEAMASRLAVVAYDYAAAGELIRHGDNGLLARFNVPADFVAKAEWLAANPGSIFRLGFRARRAAEALDWDVIHDRFEQILADTVQVKEPRHDDLPRLPSIPD